MNVRRENDALGSREASARQFAEATSAEAVCRLGFAARPHAANRESPAG